MELKMNGVGVKKSLGLMLY